MSLCKIVCISLSDLGRSSENGMLVDTEDGDEGRRSHFRDILCGRLPFSTCNHHRVVGKTYPINTAPERWDGFKITVETLIEAFSN